MYEANYISAEGSLRISVPSLTLRRRKGKKWASSVVFTMAVRFGQRSRPMAFAGSSDRSSNPVKGEPQPVLITWRNASSEAKSPSQGKKCLRAPAKSAEGSSRTARACGTIRRMKITCAQSSAA